MRKDIEYEVLKGLGTRIRDYRIQRNIKQSQLEMLSGVSISTIVRIENGEDSKISNLIKILNALHLLDDFVEIIPETKPDYKRIYQRKEPRRRVGRSVSPKSSWKPAIAKPWVWAEDRHE